MQPCSYSQSRLNVVHFQLVPISSLSNSNAYTQSHPSVDHCNVNLKLCMFGQIKAHIINKIWHFRHINPLPFESVCSLSIEKQNK